MSFPAKASLFQHNFVPELNVVGNYQELPACRDFELRYTECLVAYGIKNGREKCTDFGDDLRECVYQTKQNFRARIISAKRNRTTYLLPHTV